jgi:hypothetical protein
MEIVKYTLEDGKELNPEEHEAMAARLEAASKCPYVYDPDCPLLTPEQLAEFRPVNFATMEERAESMREAGIFDPEAVGQETVLETINNFEIR